MVFAVRKTVEDLRKHTIFRARFALYGRAISMWFFFRFISHPISWNNKISAIILLENNYFASSFVFLSRISFVFCVCVHVHYIICSIYLWILIVKLKIPIQKLENIQCFFFLSIRLIGIALDSMTRNIREKKPNGKITLTLVETQNFKNSPDRIFVFFVYITRINSKRVAIFLGIAISVEIETNQFSWRHDLFVNYNKFNVSLVVT